MKLLFVVFLSSISLTTWAFETVHYEGVSSDNQTPCWFDFQLDGQKVVGLSGQALGESKVVNVLGTCKSAIFCHKKGLMTTKLINGDDLSSTETFNKFKFVQTGNLNARLFRVEGQNSLSESKDIVFLSKSNGKIVFGERVKSFLGLTVGQKNLSCTLL